MMKLIKKLVCGMEKRYVKASIIAPIAMLVEVFLQTIIPVLMSRIIDIGIAQKDLSYTVKIGLLMGSSALLALVFGVISARCSAVGALGFAKNLRERMFNRVQDFSCANTDNLGIASLITRLTTDVTNTQNMYMMIIRIAVRAPLMLIMSVVMCFYINVSLSLIFAAIIPVMAVVIAFIGTKAFPRFKKMLKLYDDLNAEVRENLSAIRVIKAFVREDFKNEKFIKAAHNVKEAQFKAEYLVITAFPLMFFILYLTIILVEWRGGLMIVGGTLLTGELVSMISYAGQVMFAVMMLGMIFVNLIISRASVSRIEEVLDEKPSIKNKAITKKCSPNSGSIEFRDVSFSYTQDVHNTVLTAINFSIKSGQTVGIIGGTGSSKSTLVQLIPRLYEVTSGSVLVDGMDVRDYEVDELRKNVSMVLQNNVLFSGTIRENLKWGNLDATDQELKEACIASDAYDFIISFPQGFDTVLGQGGVNVSGGQKQRLCIARALLTKPKVLIFDDSTSAVDTSTDARIRSALKKELSDTTKIIIAQRIDSIKDADTIFVMDDGCIIDKGEHNELLKTSSIYREVFEQQCEGKENN